MSTTVKSKYDWFGVLKMSGLLVSEVIYRDHFDKAPGVTKDEYFKLRKHIDRFNSESYTVNDLVKALLFDNLNHDPDSWIFGTTTEKGSPLISFFYLRTGRLRAL